MATKNTNSKKSVLAFNVAESESVVRTRASRTASNGGRYSVKTRRLTVPKGLAGKKVDVRLFKGHLVVGGSGDYAVHKTQHFVTLPAGTVESTKNVTLEKGALEGLPEGAVAYLLPTPKAKE